MKVPAHGDEDVLLDAVGLGFILHHFLHKDVYLQKNAQAAVEG